MNALVNYIQTHPAWREELSDAPYHLVIKDDGPYTIFNYNQIKSDFKLAEVQVARGIILKISEEESEHVLVNGGARTKIEIALQRFDKFFNFSEPLAAKIDWATARVTEKRDGSIIGGWFDENSWHFSTNGVINAFACDLMMPTHDCATFGDLFMIAACETIDDNWGEFLRSLDPNIMYTWELATPFNRVVVPYKENTIALIGARDATTLQELDVWEHTELLPKVPRPKVYSMKSPEEILETLLNLPYSEEGYVVMDAQFNRTKWKGTAYLAAHRLKDNSNVNPRRVLELVKKGEQDEFLAYFPEYTDIFNEVKEKWESFVDAVGNVINWTNEKKIVGMSKKDFALQVKSSWMKPIFHSIAFAAWDGKSVSELIDKLDYDRL